MRPALAAGRGWRTGLVTGGTSGLGAAVAAMLEEEGLAVWTVSRRPVAGGGGGRHVVADLAVPGAAAAAWAEAGRRAGREPDVVVHAAGSVVAGRVEDVTAADWAAQGQLHVGAAAELARVAGPGLRARGSGAFVVVSSLAAELPLPFHASYNAAKAALSALARSLELEGWPAAGVAVVDVRPGDIRTPIAEAAVLRTAGEAEVARVAARARRLVAAAPGPERVAEPLRRWLRAGRSGPLRAGTFFQAGLAPLGARLAPWGWTRALVLRYHHAGRPRSP